MLIERARAAFGEAPARRSRGSRTDPVAAARPPARTSAQSPHASFTSWRSDGSGRRFLPLSHYRSGRGCGSGYARYGPGSPDVGCPLFVVISDVCGFGAVLALVCLSVRRAGPERRVSTVASASSAARKCRRRQTTRPPPRRRRGTAPAANGSPAPHLRSRGPWWACHSMSCARGCRPHRPHALNPQFIASPTRSKPRVCWRCGRV